MTDFRVRGFAGSRHPEQIPAGSLLLETTHITEASAMMEIEALRARMRRGAVSHAELIDQRPGGTLTNLHVYADTRVAWSWERAARG